MLKNYLDLVQKEADDYLTFLLNTRFFQYWKNKILGEKYSTIEIYLTNSCNQNCEYCYLKNNFNIYPKEYNNQETIIKNYKIFLDFLLKEKAKINKIEFFSGDIWHTNFGIQILEILYEYCKKEKICDSIIIPSNCYFVTKYETLMPIQNLINKFEQIDVNLVFSVSIDGKIIEEDVRPLDNKIVRDDECYDDIFAFAKNNGYGYHPMISACGIKEWKENYFWWKKMCKKYSLNLYESVMMLEVRNDDWTEENLCYYKNLLITMLDDFYCSEYIKNKKERFLDLLLDNWKDDQLSIDNYFPFMLPTIHNAMPCSVDKYLTVRMGELAICPCHRLAYENNIYGYFTVKNNQIVGLTAKNNELATRILFGNPIMCNIKCDNCLYSDFCLRGCLGAQKEKTKDPFIPLDSVCNLFKTKIRTILEWSNEKGIIDSLEKMTPKEKGWNKAKNLLEIWEHIKNEKSEN